MTASARALPLPGWAPRLDGRSGQRALLSLVLGIAAGSALLLGRLGGALEGPAGVGVAVLLVLMVPTSRDLCRRVLVAGCVVLGWAPIAWWLPSQEVGRVTIGLVLLAAALGAWVGWGDRPLQRLQLLVPRMRPVDALVPVTALVGMLALAPWLREKRPAQTLGILFDGWDNSAHFAMVSMIRRFGATVDALPAPAAGGQWQFESYPQGFHAVVAALIELRSGPVPGDLAAELLAYSQGVAMVVVLVTTVVVAGLSALPALRVRPAVTVPVAAFVMALFYAGPASTSIQGGIGNFTLACALAIAAALVAVAAPRALDPWTIVAIGGAVVGVAFSWVLLVALAAPAALLLLVPLRRRWMLSRTSVIVAAVVAVAVALCVWRVLVVLGRVRAADPLTIVSGGMPPVDLGLFLVGSLGTLAGCWLVARRRRNAATLRVVALSAVPAFGIAVTIALVTAQIAANGRVSYYGYKFMLGVEIVTLVLLVVPVAYSLSPVLGGRSVWASARIGAASVVLAIAVSQVFGFTVLGYGIRGLVASAPGAQAYAAQMRAIDVTPSVADLADRVEDLQRAGQVPPLAFYVDARADRAPDPILMGQWYLALTSTWTAQANDVVSKIDGMYYRRDPATAVRTLLAASPDCVVLVPLEYRLEILDALNLPFLDDRVIGI